jgi:hypothetical protein
MGDVHFLILDSERPSRPGTQQHNFAVSDLAGVDRSTTPWIVVGLHRMTAAPSTDSRPVVGDQDNMARLMADYEELFSRSGVCGGARAAARWGGGALTAQEILCDCCERLPDLAVAL